uniref:PX domain-containing protein n=1 Tax=Globisporangium ultimum (strain ATCC 200006 / CBS 805.95 / DAOM BR144) TaxID=431595 RepID=K3XAY1_GLOUD
MELQRNSFDRGGNDGARSAGAGGPTNDSNSAHDAGRESTGSSKRAPSVAATATREKDAILTTETAAAVPSAAHTTEATRASKHVLVSCRIGGHTIEKGTSPKKKALDPMRYMPDRATFYALFTVHAQFEDATTDHQVYRTYKQFAALHSRLQKKYPKSNFPRELPTMRKKRYDNEYIEQKKHELNQYLKQLLELLEIKQSKTLREFLEDSHLPDDCDEDEVNPSMKMLEGLPGTIVTVRAGQSFSVSVNLSSAGDAVSWQFTTKKHNIGFSATFNGDTIRVYSREDSQVKPVKGFYKCTEPGTCTLNWDNTYTWSKGKVLIYWAEVKQAKPDLPLPVNGGPDPTSTQQSTSDGRRAGYIEKNRNHALYPRRIMNTSISLITKPFVSGKPSHQQEQYKAGPLIVERNIKFRGRNWYRKWFVLDTRKCILRYYDSESAARRGLSISKLNLNHKSASLAITSGEEAAPTPFMFVARTRKRCWKICASSLAEYNEWEHAISTALLTAQLSKRRRSGSKNDADVDRQDGTRGSSQLSQEAGNSMLQGDQGGELDDSEESEEDEDEDDHGKDGDDGDSDGDQSASDSELGHEMIKPVVIKETSRSATSHALFDSHASSPFAFYLDTIGAWELKWKICALVLINCVLLGIRWTPWAIVVGGLVLCNGGVIAMKLLEARSQEPKKKLKQS